MKWLVLALSLVLAAAPAYACDVTESPNCPDPGGNALIGTGIALMATVPLGGLITAIGGATKLHSKGWRRANYVFGTLGLIEAITLGAVGAAIYDPHDPMKGQGLIGGGVAALVVGATDVGLAVASAVKSSPRVPRMTVVPLAGRDLGGLQLTGRF
jgi:hypothetical protein